MLRAPFRRISNTNSLKKIGRHYSNKTGKHLIYESDPERSMLLALEANPEIARLDTQNRKFLYWHGGKAREYKPDIEVIWRDVWRPHWYVECKDAKGALSDESQQKFAAIADQLGLLGHHFSLHRLPEIEASAAFVNARELRQSTQHRCRPEEWVLISQKLPCKLGELYADPRIRKLSVQNFLWFGELHFDRTKRLTDDLLITHGKARLIWTAS